jgi:hypothetical protein
VARASPGASTPVGGAGGCLCPLLRGLILAGGQNTEQSLRVDLTHQAVLAESGVGPVNVHRIEKSNEAHHEN